MKRLVRHATQAGAPGVGRPRAFCRLVLLALAVLALTQRPAYPAASPAGQSAGAEGPQASAPEAQRERGQQALRQGALEEAARELEAAAEAFARAGDVPNRCATLILLGQSRLFLGKHRAALESSGEALELARASGDPRRTATASGALGNVHLAMGNSEGARQAFAEALALAKEHALRDVGPAVLTGLGNLYAWEEDYDRALASYREAATLAASAGDHPSEAEALVNAAAAAARGARWGEVLPLLQRAAAPLGEAPDTYAKAHTLANAGLLYRDLRAHLPGEAPALLTQAHAALTEALAVAQRLQDERALSYAAGYLGSLYEDTGQYPEALELTRRAVFAAQRCGASEALYRWHWQTGRILARLGQLDPAIASYRLSMGDLQAIRDGMSSCYASPEASYQKTAGTVCLELVDLLLQRASRLGDGEAVDPFLAEARDALEQVKVFELREYFQDDCLDAARATQKKLDVVSERAAVIYPVLLPDRVELLVSFAGRLKRFALPVGVDELTRETREMRRKLMKRTTWEFLPHAQRLYEWMIRPLEADLAALRPDTLVFVPDGPLRTIPLSALHDGRDFLVRRYAVAVTPSLSLTDPKPVAREHVRLLSLGLTQPVQGFPGLPYVADELRSIRDLYGGEVLVDDAFRLQNVEDALKQEPYNIVHIASHGQFGQDVSGTFLLAFDEKFTMERLSQYVGLFRFREEPLDLLALSACETAAGNDRAALGLAGIAVRAGARSALATLWHVNDPASYELVVEFYRQLGDPSHSRAAALQAAQLKLLDDARYDHPGYWAPFLLINNWL